MTAVPHHTEIVNVQTKDDHQTCLDLRIRVFVEEQGFAMEVERDEYDNFPREDVIHLLARDRDTNEPLGTIRMIRKSATTVKLGRLAVRSDIRGRSIGRILVDAGEAASIMAWGPGTDHDGRRAQPGIREIVANSQEDKRGFYEKCGYVMDEKLGVFNEDGGPHVKVVKML
ncbi:acyl-CoA N-acyltransferase [Saitoella complicata NRRL Y-17804]|nr:acyl-CoA N-acyltransferase [Saitoella complicata NRRL Y-17804]ODQ53385.1 acyl-CoA N-acyltransferase [Saitoella complicata NRRL Y-17804]